jgi:isoleucyl-tRNA synthetase
MADYVSVEDGTGLVHIAPSFGAEDMEVGKVEDLPCFDDGWTRRAVYPGSNRLGGNVRKDADPLISKELSARGRMLKHGKIKHSYPFCWRCNTPLLYYARPTWFIRTSHV